jgi:hypothetical protein
MVELSRQFKATAILSRGKAQPVLTGRNPQPIWMLWKKEKSLSSSEN